MSARESFGKISHVSMNYPFINAYILQLDYLSLQNC